MNTNEPGFTAENVLELLISLGLFLGFVILCAVVAVGVAAIRREQMRLTLTGELWPNRRNGHD